MTVRQWLSRWRGRGMSSDVCEEIRAHVDERMDDLMEAGMPEMEARRRARIELGNATRAVEDSRQVWRSRMWEDFRRDLLWARRGLRARRGRALLSMTLLALALAANVVTFAVTDSLALDRMPYPNAARIVTIQHVKKWGPDSFLAPQELDQWRRRSDLFAAVHGFFTGTTFLLGRETAEQLDMASVTPGLIEALGVKPRWGRPLMPEDSRRADEQTVLISERLARRYFGSPSESVGGILQTAARPLRIVGVMPGSFAFPNGRFEIWRALDPRGELARGYAGTSSVALLRMGVSVSAASRAVRSRGPALGSAGGDATPQEMQISALDGAVGPEQSTRMLMALSGAALMLLLTACVNVFGLELAGILARTRTLAIQSALGATRQTLVRVIVLEGVCLIALSALAAWGVTVAALSAIGTALPKWLQSSSANRIDLDLRAVGYMLLVTGAAWVLSTLPAALYASRLDLAGPLKLDDRTTAASHVGQSIRRVVTVAQVALATLLVIIGGLYARTYVRLLAVEKGFDSSNLASVSMALPGSFYPADDGVRELSARLTDRLRRLPDVVAATVGPPPPSSGNSPNAGVTIAVDGGPPDRSPIGFSATAVGPEYFAVLGVPLRSGRWLVPGEPPASVLVSESFARRYWTDGDAAGHTFAPFRGAQPWSTPHVFRVVGVFGDYRTGDRAVPTPADAAFHVFTARQPPPPPVPRSGPANRNGIDGGGFYRFIDIVVRLRSRAAAPAVLAAARSVDPRLEMTLEFVDDRYADRHAETLLATRVVGAFGFGAFAIAMAGVYGVMSLLVLGRRREIGIRMALGADRRRIGRLVLGTSFRLVALGLLAGLGLAWMASRLIASQLFDTSPTDPATYGVVALVILVTAVLATWQPARRAARVDPVQTLKSE
jgi:predicted permease